MTITDTTIPSTAVYDRLFDECLGHRGDRIVLIDADCPDHFYTLGDIKSKIMIFANKIGVVWPKLKGGDVVAQCSPNEIDLVIAGQGLVCAGATVAVIDHTRADEEALVKDIKTTNARYILTHPKVLEKVLNAAEQLGIPKTNILVCGDTPTQGISCLSPLLESEEVGIDTCTATRRNIRDPAFIFFTSGTTGVNKAVKLSYETILHSFNLLQAKKKSIEKASQKYIGFLRFYHSPGIFLALEQAILYANPVYIMKKFDLQKFYTYVERYKCTTSAMLPCEAAYIARDPLAKNYDLSSLKDVTVMGENPDPSLVHDFKERLDANLFNFYGMTELSPPFESKLEYIKKGAIGKVKSGVLVKLIDDNGNEATEGELRVKGPNVTQGYCNNEEANKTAFDDEGYFCTGDIFKVDGEGIFSFVSRKKEMITYGQYTMYPGAIEKLVLQAPNVAQCAVIGIYDDSVCTELLTAFIERTKSAKDSEIDEKSPTSVAQRVMDYVNSLVDSNAAEDCFRLRGGVLVVDSLPHNNVGKVMRAKLRENAGTFRHAYFP